MDIKYFTEINRQAWNYVTPIHQSAGKEKWDEFFTNENAIVQSSLELDMLKAIGITGRDIVHLCCNNGVELLSLKKLGANRAVGFDICDEAIGEAKERALKLNADIEYVRADAYEIPDTYDKSFDMAYISVGALRWLPDLDLFFKSVDRLLRDKGYLFIYEMHPLTEIINDDRDKSLNPLMLINSYFNKEALHDNKSLDYVGHTNEKGKLKYWFIHTLADIFSSIINNNIGIKVFKEYQHDISGVYSLIESQEIKIPLSFILIGEKG